VHHAGGGRDPPRCRVTDGAADQFLEHGRIDAGDPPEVEAALPLPVLPEPGEQVAVPGEVAGEYDLGGSP
jgi:hypothetical protein